jgi:hypothetical protein
MRTVDTLRGPLPVLDVWRECRNTDTGWSAVNEKGERLNITYPPGERDSGLARVPPDDMGHVILVRGGVIEGVALIERTSRATAKKKAPAA